MGLFFKGIHWRDPRLTRSPRLWWQYFCWCIQHWMSNHRPLYPMFVRRFLCRFFPDERRYHLSWRTWYWWRDGLGTEVDFKPLPWWVGEGFIGPFVIPWNKTRGWFRSRTGGRSHRCEFTDPRRGALYGGVEGPYMDRYFEQFIAAISDEPDTEG